MLMHIHWVRGPSGVYQSRGDGRYVLYPTGGGMYRVQLHGKPAYYTGTLDQAMNWCEVHHQEKDREP